VIFWKEKNIIDTTFERQVRPVYKIFLGIEKNEQKIEKFVLPLSPPPIWSGI
jgi:hypothetical protein